MQNSNEISTDDGVGYYNILKYIEIKNNKEKHIANEETSFTSINQNNCLSDPSGLAPLLPASPNIPPGIPELPQVVGEGISEPTPPLNESMIERAIIQFFDNGPQSKQQYKLKVRLNLKDDKTNPEFIASLTKDFRNFKQYVPAECRKEIIDTADELRLIVKNKFDVKPFLGKFHFNNGHSSQGARTIQIEPYTLAAVWWDSINRGWSGMIQIYEWVYKFDLFERNITDKQAKAGVVAQTLFVNPAHSKIQRPKTWAEQRAGK